MTSPNTKSAPANGGITLLVTGHFKTSHQRANQNQPLQGGLSHTFLSVSRQAWIVIGQITRAGGVLRALSSRARRPDRL